MSYEKKHTIQNKISFREAYGKTYRRPRLKTDAEILASLREEVAEDLEVYEGTQEQRDRLEYIDGAKGTSLPTTVEDNLHIQRGEPIRIEKAYKEANPNYGTSPEYTKNNCQNCVGTYELRRRGYDVEALPRNARSTDADIIYTGAEIFNDHKNIGHSMLGGDGTSLSKKLLVEQLNGLPDGSRCGILIRYKDTSNGHAFVSEKRNGEVRFFDPQKGAELNIADVQAARGCYAYYRTDTLTLNENVSLIVRRH